MGQYPVICLGQKGADGQGIVRAVKGVLIRCIIPGVEHIKDGFAHMVFSFFSIVIEILQVSGI